MSLILYQLVLYFQKKRFYKTGYMVKRTMQFYSAFQIKAPLDDGVVVLDSVNMTLRDEENILDQIYEKQI